MRFTLSLSVYKTPVKRKKPVLPHDCVGSILAFLPPKQRFCIATHCRWQEIQRACLPVLDYASMFHASRKAQCDLLDVLLAHLGIDMVQKGATMAMAIASAYGHTTVLEWWKQHFLVLDAQVPLLYASEAAQLSSLEWWEMSGIPLNISKWQPLVFMINVSYPRGVRRWWKRMFIARVWEKF